MVAIDRAELEYGIIAFKDFSGIANGWTKATDIIDQMWK